MLNKWALFIHMLAFQHFDQPRWHLPWLPKYMNVLIAKLGITISSLFTVSILLMPMIMKIILTIRDGIFAIYDWSVIYFVLLLLFSDLEF